MKIALIFTLGLAVAASAQVQFPGQTATDDKPLAFVRAAAEIAQNVQQKSLDNFLGIYISPENWKSAADDGDLGPYMKLKGAPAKPGRSATCLISMNKDITICVFFDGDDPFGVVSVAAGSSGKVGDDQIAAAYKPITKEMRKKSDRKLDFTAGPVNADDGTRLPGFLIKTAQ